MKCTIGINANHADSSSVIFLDNKLIFGIEEERLNRIKHWAGLPFKSLNLCLEIAKKNNIKDIDVAINTNSFSNFSHKLIYTLRNYIFGYKKFEILKRHRNKLLIAKELRDKFKTFNFNFNYIDHHLSHIASAYYPSNYDNAYAISIDGFGDFSSIVVAKCKEGEINLIKKIYFPNSLGVFYEGFTQMLGFKNYGDEYKLMGLSCYGKPLYKDVILNEIFEDKKKFKLNLNYFNHHKKNFTYNFSGVPNQNQILDIKKIEFFDHSKFNYNENFQYVADIASSVQKVFESLLNQLIDEIKKDNFSDNLVLAGGCALNSLANGKLLENEKFKNIFIPYSPGDSGGAIGAGIINIKKKQRYAKFDNLNSPYIGTNYSNEYIELKLNKINKSKLNIKKLNDSELTDKITDLLINSSIIGHFKGSMEYGPRSLGNRAILADPTNPNIKNIINQKIKRRENFRPFAPVMLQEYKKEWFRKDNRNPYMSFVESIIEEKQKFIPAVTHVDGTGRIQTVNKEENEFLYNLIFNFYKKTNVPILLNTSFNENEPMVENPEQAIDCFLRTDMDALVLENFIILKK